MLPALERVRVLDNFSDCTLECRLTRPLLLEPNSVDLSRLLVTQLARLVEVVHQGPVDRENERRGGGRGATKTKQVRQQPGGEVGQISDEPFHDVTAENIRACAGRPLRRGSLPRPLGGWFGGCGLCTAATARPDFVSGEDGGNETILQTKSKDENQHEQCGSSGKMEADGADQ